VIGRRTALVALGILLFALPYALRFVSPQATNASSWELISFDKQSVVHVAVGEGAGGAIRYAAVAGLGILRNTDNPSLWAHKWSGLPQGLLGSINVRELAVASDDPRLVYAAIDNGRSGGGIYVTENGGASWRLADPSLQGHAQAISLAQHEDKAIYAAVDGSLFRRLGAGRWERIPWSLPLPITCIAIDPSDAHAILVGTKSAGILWSQDAGDSWTMVAGDLASLNVRAIAFSQDDSATTAYVGTGRGLYRMSLGGAGWQPLLIWPDVSVGAMLPIESPPSLIVGLVQAGVYRGDGNSDNWVHLGEGIAGIDVNSLAPEEAEQRQLYAGTSDGLWRLDIGASE
jgi:photosystem II stability/assembly factor-like uncharacterized protein